MKKLAIIFCTLLYASIVFAQNINEQSTTGKIPPIGINIIGHVSDNKNITAQQIISGVPCYLWQHGCGPTSVGMVAGYYALHGFSALISGSALTQTSSVNTAMASQENYNDYCLPEDSYPNLLNDLSELPAGDEHINNCIADFMKTSQSTLGNYYGWSWSNDIKPSWENYISYKNAGYTGLCTKYYFSSFPWDSIVHNVNNNLPMVFLVDTDGDGLTDHFVCVNGYKTDLGVNYYGCFNTWDSSQHWYTFSPMASGTQWGISSCYTFKISNANGINSNNIIHNNILKCYPNPIINNLQIDFNYIPTDSYSITIVNIIGKKVYSINKINGGSIIINKQELNEGAYFVQLFCNNKLLDCKKIIVQ